MQSSYVMNSASTRTNGPAVGGMYPNGCFIEDYTYVAGSGDLDERNGRFCITPDYPAGTYAYFVTIDSNLDPQFPYTFFGTYYGVVQAGNTGMGSGHVTISEPTTIYTETTDVKEVTDDIRFTLSENPVKDFAYIYFDPKSVNNVTPEIYDIRGQILFSQSNMQPSISYTFDFTGYSTGTYFLYLTTANKRVVQKIIKVN